MLPITGNETEVELDPAGIFHYGTTDPNDEAFDSRSTWFAAENVIEMRVPWQAIGFTDPSTRTVFDVSREGVIENIEIDRIEIALAAGGELLETDGYEWEPWNQVRYTERVKAGSDVFARKVIALNR